MARYTFQDSAGMTVEVEADHEPTATEMAPLFAQARQPTTGTAPLRRLSYPEILDAQDRIAALPSHDPERQTLEQELGRQAQHEYGGLDAATAGFTRSLVGQGLARILAHQPYVSDTARDEIMRRVALAPYHRPEGFLAETAAFAGKTIGDAPLFAVGGPVGGAARALGAGKVLAGVAGSLATGAAMGAADKAAEALNNVASDEGAGTRMAKSALEFAPMGLPVPVPVLRRGYQSLVANALKDSALVAVANPLVESIAKFEAPDFSQVPAQFAGNIVPFLLLQGLHVNDLRQAEAWRQTVLKAAGQDAALPDGKPVAGLDYDQLFQALGKGQVPIPNGPPVPAGLAAPPATAPPPAENAPGVDAGLVIGSDEPVMQHLAALARQNRETRRQALAQGLEANPTTTYEVAAKLPAAATETGLTEVVAPAGTTPVDQMLAAAKDRQDLTTARRAAELLVRNGSGWAVKEDARPLEIQAAMGEVQQAVANQAIPAAVAAPMLQRLGEELQARQALAALDGKATQSPESRVQSPEPKPRHIPIPPSVGKAQEAYKLGLVRLAEEGGDRGQEALRRLRGTPEEPGPYPDAQSIEDIPETVRIKALYLENPAPGRAEQLATLERQLAELNAMPGGEPQLENQKGQVRRLLHERIGALGARRDMTPPTSTGESVVPTPAQAAETTSNPVAAGKPQPQGDRVVPTPAQEPAADTATAPDNRGQKPAPTTETKPAEPWRQRREEYAVPVKAGYLGRKDPAAVQRFTQQQAEHRAAVETALREGKLSREEYNGLHREAYGRYGSVGFNKAFPAFATAGEVIDTVGDFQIRKKPGSQLIALQREVVGGTGERQAVGAAKPLLDTPRNREKLRTEARTLLDAEAFDSLALGLFGTEADQAQMGAPRAADPYRRAPTAIKSADNAVYRDVRQQAARALGLSAGQAELLAVPEKRAARLADLQRLEPTPVGTVAELATALQRHGLKRPGGRQRVTKAEAEALASVAARFAETHKVALQDVVAAVRSGTAVDAQRLGGLGSEKGATTFPVDGETLGATLHLFRGADASTAVHEFFHAFFPHLGTEHARTLAAEMRGEVLGLESGVQSLESRVVDTRLRTQDARLPEWARGVVKDGAELRAVLANLDPVDLTPQQQQLVQEWGARSFERYLQEGQTSVPALREVFAKVAEWMRQIYAAVKGTSIEGQLSAETRRVFEEMLGADRTAKEEGRGLPDAAGPRAERGGREAQQIAESSLPDNLTDAEKNQVRSLNFLIAGTDKTVANIEQQIERDRANLDRHRAALTKDQIADEERRINGFARDVADLRKQQAKQQVERQQILDNSNSRSEQGNLFGKAPATAAGELQDFGQKLGGARKDQVPSATKDISDADLETMSFSEIWPKSELGAIQDPDLAALATALRSVIPAKPRKGYKVQRWVEQVRLVRSLMQYANENGFEAVLAKMNDGQYQQTLSGFREKINLLRQLPRTEWDRIGRVENYPDAYRFEKDAAGQTKQVKVPYAMAEVDGRPVSAPGVDELTAKVVERLGVAADVAGMQFEIRGPRSGDGAFINKKGDPLYRKLKEFTGPDALDQARAFLKHNRADLAAAWEAVKATDNVKETDVRRETNRPRTAKEYRQGKDVTPQMFQDAFGFRGVEFGNWVDQGVNQRERQGMINQAFDALMDLADVIGVPAKALSLNGELGLGFGSRGHGWAAAHYEPGKIVINLTKTRGAGTLAHEWFHALDHYFQRQRQGQISRAAHGGNMITYQPEAYYEHGPTGQRLSATRFTQVRVTNPTEWRRIEGVRPEVEQAFTELVQALNDSPMAKRAALIDAGKSGGYWSRIIERAARAFENYVIARMTQQGYHNDYLANVVSIENFHRDAGRYPYLLDNEVAPVAAAFDKLFETLETRATDKGVALFQPGESGREQQYRAEDVEGDVERPVRVVRAGPDVSPRIEEARRWARDNLQGKELQNRETGITAVPSNDSIGKMLSGGKPYAGERAAAIYSLPELFAEAARTSRHADDGSDRQVAQIHEFHAPFEYKGQVYRVRMLAKEFVPSTNWPNKLHSYRLEDVVVEKETSAGTRAIGGGQAAQRNTPSADTLTLRQLFNGFKSQGDRSVLFQREEASPTPTGPARYTVRAANGRLWVWDGKQDRAYQPTHSIYSKPVEHPNARLDLERIAAELNALEEHRTAPGSLRAAGEAISDQPSAFSGEGGGGDGGNRGRKPAPTGPGGEGGGDLPPVETHTPSVWRWIFGNSGVDLLIKGGGPLKVVAEKVKAYYDRWADLKGQIGKPIRAVLDPLSRADRRAVLDEFEKYMQARESSPESSVQSPESRKADLLAGLRPETRALAKAWDDLTEFTSAENQRLGIKVREGNQWRDIGSFGRDYWPRMIREDIADILRQGKGAQYEALIQEAATHWNVTPERAAQKLGEARSSLQSADDYFANLEAARTAELPAPWYDYRPEVVGARFIDSWAKRFAQIEQFGQVTTGAYAGEKSWSGQAFKDAFQQTRNDPNAVLVLRAVHDDVFGVRDKKFYDPAVNALRTYTSLSKYVTNPWASIRNLTQPFVTTLPEFGPRAFAKGMFDAILHGKEYWQLAKDAGIIQDDMLAGFVVAEDFNAKQQQIIRNAAKYTGSEFAEQWNRVMTVAAARAWARDALSELQSDPTARKSLLAKAGFNRLEVNWETMAKEMHRGDAHGPEWRKFERAAVTGTQFGYDMRQSPVWSGTPAAKLLFQFQKFGLQMHRRMWQEVVLPATQGETVDGVKVRNYGKALLTMGAMLGVGEVMLSAVRAVLFDKRRKDADWEEIARTLDKNTWRGMQVALPHLVNNIWYSGALGSLADWGQNAYNTATGFKGKNPLEPPSFSSLRNLVNTGLRIYAEEGVNSKQFADWITNELPAVNYGGAIAKRLSGQELLTAREDYRELKAAGGRFLDEIGEERAKRGGEYTRTWKSPFYDDLFDALVTGDRPRAKSVVDEMLAQAKDPAEKRDLMQGIKANILSRRPLRAGGVDADTQRAFRQQFAAWLQDRNPELAPKMQALDARYMETAHALGVAPSAAQAELQDKVAGIKEKVGKTNRVRQSLVQALADREKVGVDAANAAYDRIEERRATQPIVEKYQAEIEAAVSGQPPPRLAGKVTPAVWQRMVLGQGANLAAASAELRAEVAAINRQPDLSVEEKRTAREAVWKAAYVARMERLGRANGQRGALAGFPTLAELRAELRN